MTMTLIQSFTVSGSSSQISLTGIPATFTHLQLRVNGRSADTGTAARQIYVNFNSDSGTTNYYGHYFIGDGANPATGQATTTMYAGVSCMPASGSTSTIWGASIIDVLDYANTTKYKTIKALHGTDLYGAGAVGFSSGQWRSFVAVNSIQLLTEGNFAIGTRVDLYGLISSDQTGA